MVELQNVAPTDRLRVAAAGGCQLAGGELWWTGETNEVGRDGNSDVVGLGIVAERLIRVRQSCLRGQKPHTGQ